ncbi:YrvL family regulatory protein [Halobacillus seohaensis]|uniref:YrvL family regulatory protein n=1 Tax=Halobacillus seohaensis TaxID=447421 RepID=A0ABW2EM67_9BACI
MSKKKPFNELDIKTRVIFITSLSFIILFGITVVLVGFFLGMVGFFQVTGVTYASKQSLLLFGTLVFLIGFIFEVFGKIVTSYSLKFQLKSSAYLKVKIAIEFLFAWFAVYAVNKVVASVSMPLWSQGVFALLLIAVDYAFDDRQLKKQKLA